MIEANFGVDADESCDVRLGQAAVDLALGELARAEHRLAGIEVPASDTLNLVTIELFRGVLAMRLAPRDPASAAALGRVHDRAQAVPGSAAMVEILLDSVNADSKERELASPP